MNELMILIIVVMLVAVVALCVLMYKSNQAQALGVVRFMGDIRTQSTNQTVDISNVLATFNRIADDRFRASDAHAADLLASLQATHVKSLDHSSVLVNTLDQLFRLANDRCLNISDAHLEAKRDEWAGKHVHSQVARPRVIEEPATVEEGAEQNWGDVSAVGTPNGRS